MRTKGIRKGVYYAIVAVISIIAGYIFSSGRIFDSPRMFFLLTSWSMAIFFTQSIGNGYLIEKLDTRISWLTHPWKRLLIGFLVLVLFSFTAFQIVQLSFEYFVFGYNKEDFFTGAEFWNRFFRTGRIAVIVSIVISTIMTAIGFFRGWREAAVNSEKLKNEVVAQQYATLRNQMNPHFLFNSLNVLSELVYENQDQAVRFIRKLSDVYRYVLDSRDKEVVPIDEEVEFLKTFAALLKERFSSNFEFEISGMESHKGDLFIVPMALQLLLENAVKHNVVSSAQPLKVSLIFMENAVRMENQIQLK
ncbi:MAG: two-component system LytT family sensor kinase, partial [Flavobacteriales bacterium]